MAVRKNIYNMPQGPPNPGFMQKKVQKGDFLKKDSRELKIFSQLVPGYAKSRIYAGKSTKWGFSKKGLTRIEKKFLF